MYNYFVPAQKEREFMLSINDLKKESEDKKILLDINCDLAQSFGVYKNDTEYELLPFVSSVNISCGLHSGDPLVINNALKIAAKNNLSIGAHIGYPDLQGFGYREISLSAEELEAIVLYQIGAIQAMAKSHNLKVSHVRLHGALYKKALEDFQTMLVIAKTIKKIDPWMIFLCAPCPNLEKACEEVELKYGAEVFLNKKYNVDGLPDFDSNEIVDIEYSQKQLENIISGEGIINKNGGITPIEVHSIHLNMANSVALEIAQMAKNKLEELAPLSVSILSDKSWI